MIGVTAQEATLHGVVTDEKSGEKLFGASVRLGDGKGVMTDENGAYRITLAAGTYNAEFGLVGYRSRPVQVVLAAGEDRTLDVKLGEGNTEPPEARWLEDQIGRASCRERV